MSVDYIILLAVLGVFGLILWRLNSGKGKAKPTKSKSRQKPTATSTTSPTTSPTSAETTANEAEEAPIQQEIPDDFLNFTLLFEDDLNDQQKTDIATMTKDFRKPHPLLLPLTQGSFEPNELFDLIKTDPEMTAKILKAVNSPMFALKQPIASIHHAIIFMGVTQVKNIAMQFLMQNSVSNKNQPKGNDGAYDKLWLASHMASALCLLLAKNLSKRNATELSTQCLLCYLGDMAMLAYKPAIADSYLNQPSLFKRVNKVQNVLGTNAAVIGKILAQQWQLPESIMLGIENSLLPLVDDMADKPLPSEAFQDVLLCYLSCRLGDMIAFQGIKDISQINALNADSMAGLDFCYLPSHIQQAALGKLNTLFADPAFKRQANALIANAGASGGS